MIYCTFTGIYWSELEHIRTPAALISCTTPTQGSRAEKPFGRDIQHVCVHVCVIVLFSVCVHVCIWSVRMFCSMYMCMHVYLQNKV